MAVTREPLGVSNRMNPLNNWMLLPRRTLLKSVIVPKSATILAVSAKPVMPVKPEMS